MKKILALFILTFGIFSYSNVDACGTCHNSCDQTFYFKLRQGKTYRFGDVFNNKSNRKIKISNAASVFTESEDFNDSSSVPHFVQTDQIKRQKGIVNPRQSLKVLTSSNTYKILYYPSRGRKKDNIKIKYTINYKNADGCNGSCKKHTECANYEITWCGDGVVDSEYGEKCDPKDWSKRGWGSGGCNVKTCKPIENKQATCNGLEVDSQRGTTPINKVITCKGSNVTTFKLDCGNGQVFTGNGRKNGSENFTKTCHYTVGTKYRAKCFVDGNVTNSNCQKNFCLKDGGNPSIAITKTDLNANDKDGNIGNDTQTIKKGETSIFKIKVQNNGTEALKNITISDALAPACAGKVNFGSEQRYEYSKSQIEQAAKNKFGINISGKSYNYRENSNGIGFYYHDKNYKLYDNDFSSSTETPNTWSNFQLSGKGNHSNNILEPGEIFTYTCKKANTQSSYTNVAGVNAKGVNSNKSVNDSDPSVVKIVAPTCTGLTATKNTGAITFTSTLKCTGTDTNEYKIVVTHTDGESSQTVPSNNGIFTFSRVGTYTAKCFVEGRNDTENVCIKTITATAAPAPAITVDKVDANTTDRDNVVGNDTQTVLKGTNATFKIKVTNTGNEDLKEVSLIDTIAPNCSKTQSQSLALIKNAGNKDSMFNVGESFEYTCSKANTNDSYTNVISVNAKGKNSNKPVTDNDNTKVLVVEPMCTGLTIDKTGGEPTFVSNFTCTGINMDSYKIVIKNEAGQVIKTINSNVGQYTFNTIGKYTVECYMNDETTTGDVCKKPVVVNTSKVPSIKLDKIDANITGEKDSLVGNDTQTVLKTTDAVFKIKITNNGTEDLKEVVITDTIAPACSKTAAEAIALIKTAGDKNSIFSPGEFFEYTCSKANTTAGYTNSATVNAKGQNTNTPVNSTDTTVVKVINPGITLDKVDANTADRDSTVGNDTQTVLKTNEAVFKIRVTNNGSEDLKELNITDSIAPACDGVVNLTTKKVANNTLTITGEGDHNDNILQIGEIFEYTCSKANTTAGYTNSATVNAKGNVSNVPVNATDTTVVKVINPSIILDKVDANTADKDNTVGNDTQTVLKGTNAVFKIRVTNDGSEDLKEVVITDTIAPNCSKTATETLVLIKAVGNKDEILNKNEFFEYTCSKANTTADYTNSATVNAKGNNSNTPVDSTDTTVVKVEELPSTCNGITATPSSAKKSLTSTVVCTGTNVSTFKIDCGNSTVYTGTGSNNGKETFTKTCSYTTIGDYNPKCYVNDTITNNSCSESVSVTSGGHSGGEAKCYDIKKETNGKDITCIGNTRSKKLKVDCGNGTTFESSDLTIENGKKSHTFTCNYADDELDKYEATCYAAKYALWKTNSACKYSNTSTCGDGKINLPNSNGVNEQCEKVLVLIEDKNEADIKTEAECLAKGGNTTTKAGFCDLGFPETCNQNTCQWKPNGGGGNSSHSASCLDIKKENGIVTCTGNKDTKDFKLDCGNGEEGAKKGNIIKNGTKTLQQFTCNYDKKRTSAYRCIVRNSTTSGTWKTSNACRIEKDKQRPDTTPESNEILTFPNHGELILVPGGNQIVGDNVKIFSNDYDNKPTLINNSDYSLRFRELCLVIDSKNIGQRSIKGNTVCKNLPEIIYPGQEIKIEYSQLTNVKSRTNTITYGNFADSILITTISTPDRDAKSLANAFFAAKLNVRVAKPAVVTTGGGTSYTRSAGSANVNRIARGTNGNDYANRNTNYNYVGTSVSNTNSTDTSFSNNTSNTTINKKTDNSSINTTDTDSAITNIKRKTASAASTETSSISSFKNYNGIANVYILEGAKNFRINTTIIDSSSTKARTYIIDGGNLYIDSNFSQNENIAFVVKGGNIIIDKDVTNIKGTFIAIPVNGNGGEIKSSGSSVKQITINGSVYGNISDLVSNRIYIKNEGTNNDQLGVGTIVSFGSSIFRKPAPLVSNFIKDYMNTTRVAQ